PSPSSAPASLREFSVSERKPDYLILVSFPPPISGVSEAQQPLLRFVLNRIWGPLPAMLMGTVCQ
ncbi:hypothetical protein, partial [Erythrobacter sp. SD-21]|uniref:hypothetical protein n=1 Tax=Erythrobacter sp. SD-21 TaxID=161528 RepID=UPI001F1B2EBC